MDLLFIGPYSNNGVSRVSPFHQHPSESNFVVSNREGRSLCFAGPCSFTFPQNHTLGVEADRSIAVGVRQSLGQRFFELGFLVDSRQVLADPVPILEHHRLSM